MNLSIIPAAFDCLRKGAALRNPAGGKLTGIALSAAVGAFALSINTLAKAAGYDLHIDQNTADAIGAVAAWLVGSLFHVATTDKLGILPAKPVAGAPGDATASQQGPLAAPAGGITADTRAAAQVWAQRQADATAQNDVPGG